ncbi:MAG: Rpn family recombination-promoting nuclease/putative transposase [Magnetococcales bacterium]|nr:Rpn family recombination-promoting nuclease/putative transposase [Magnetococcales bacterium]
MTSQPTSDSIHDIHDHYFGAILSYPDNADALVREQLPAETVATLSSEPPEPVDTTHIDRELRDHTSDKLFLVKSATQDESMIYVVFDHKSSSPRKVAWQFLRYMMRALEQWVRENPNWTFLPQIVPILIYHGRYASYVADEFLALVKADPFLRPYLLNFRFIIMDLVVTDDQDLSDHPPLRAGLLSLKYAFREEDQLQVLDKIGRSLREAPMEFVYQTLRYLSKTFKAMDSPAVQQVIQQARPHVPQQEITTMLSQFARENIQIGKREGNSEFLLRQLRRRFPALPNWVEKRVAEAKLEVLEEWADRILDAHSLQDIFGDDAQIAH